MKRLAMVLVAAAACSSSSHAPTPDAYQPPLNHPICSGLRITASCSGGVASVTTTLFGMGGGSHSMCYEPTTATASCAAGCTVEFSAQREWSWPVGPFVDDPLYRLTGAPSLLCAETPRAHAGDPCDVPVQTATAPERRCMPMRADLDGSGTVIAENDLRCNAASVCEAVPAPQYASYLQACDAAVVAQYSGSTGAIVASSPVCLVAWDATMQRALSGQTIVCAGDGDCPDGALCDDQLTLLDMPGRRQGVCKPGPRGSLANTPLVPS